MAPNTKIDLEYLVQELVPLLEFKNYNGKFYIKTSRNWVYFHPSNKTKYPEAYDDILFHLMDVIDTSNLEEESWDRSWDKSDIKFLNKIIKNYLNMYPKPYQTQQSMTTSNKYRYHQTYHKTY